MTDKPSAIELLRQAKLIREKAEREASDLELQANKILSTPVPTVTVTIAGTTGSGKTTIAALIYDLLDSISVDGVKYLSYSVENFPTANKSLEKISRELDRSRLIRKSNIVVVEEDAVPVTEKKYYLQNEEDLEEVNA